ncbi:MAG: C39 family peptidase [Gammaproteobacteria bacterium]|nr:C39 family peptidase [Gammaproteobacteria bacterium]
MTFALRFADRHTAARYPLRVSGVLDWQRENDRSRAEIPLPEFTGGTILVPSLSACSDADYRFRFTLDIADQTFALNEVPSDGKKPSSGKAPSRKQTKTDRTNSISSHIDCFHVHKHIPASTLIIEATGLTNRERYLLAITARAIACEEVILPKHAVCGPVPPSLSQMQANDEIKHSICSPTCLAMLLQHFEKQIHWLDFVAACRDEATGMYGVWPLGIWAASRQGCIGAVEVFDNWEDASLLLSSGLPFVASIRYPEGSLPGSPIAASAGHLVVVYGMNEERIHVLDPAAPTVAEVARDYPASAFSSAWLRHRGAAYILLP